MFKHVTKLGQKYYKVLEMSSIKKNLHELSIAVYQLDSKLINEYQEENKKNMIKEKLNKTS